MVTANKELKAQIESLEATITKIKNMVEQADGLLNRNIDLHAELRDKAEKLVEVEESVRRLRSWRNRMPRS